MGSSREDLIEDLFHRAAELPARERRAFLLSKCDTDAALLEELESLLAHDEQAGEGFLRGDATPPPADAAPPERIGKYRVVREIGRGGMGRVYEAEQQQPKRRVALKVIRSAFADDQVVRRFAHEADILGRLQHPGVAHVYEAGSAAVNGVECPFFAMELIDGVSLDAHCEAAGLDPRQKMELLARVCDAVQHAHQKGIIHRDLKPANILVSRHDTLATPTPASGAAHDAIGQPKVLDFGVARLTEADKRRMTVETAPGHLIGTLAYMSPEQVDPRGRDIDTRCDVYALGLILYELLEGRPPLELSGLGLSEAARAIRESDPSPLSVSDRSIRGDAQTIAFKALEKDRDRRYASAAELAADIRRCLGDEPISARPASAAYQLRKLARRNMPIVAGASVGAAALLAGLAVALVFLGHAVRQRDEARAARETAQRVVDFQSRLLEQIDPQDMGRSVRRHLADEAAAITQENAAFGPDDSDTLAALLSLVNTTTIASNLMDEQILSRAAASIAEEFPGEPLLEAELRLSLAESYDSIGLYATAAEQAGLARELQRRELGEGDPAPLRAGARLAQLLDADAREDEAEQLARVVLSKQQELLGRDHPDTLETSSVLGSILVSRLRLDEAGPFLEEASRGLTRALGPGAPRSLHAQTALGDYYRELNRFDRARELYDRALDGWTRAAGEDSPEATATAQSLVLLLIYQQAYTEALPYIRRVALSHERAHGADHPRTLRAQADLGVVLRNLRMFDEARPMLESALARSRSALGDVDPVTLSLISVLGAVEMRTGNLAEAERLIRETLDSSLRVYGPDHPKSLTAQSNIGTFLETMDRFDEAVPYARASFEGRKRVMGVDNASTRSFGNFYARSLRASGRPDEAATILMENARWFEERFGEQRIGAMIARVESGMAMLDAGRPDDALKQFDRVAASLKRAETVPVSQTSTILRHRGVALLRLGEHERAQRLFEQALGQLEDADATDHWSAHLNRALIGAALVRQGRVAEGGTMLSEASLETEARRDAMRATDRPHIFSVLNEELAFLERAPDPHEPE